MGLTKPDELGVNQSIDRDDPAQTTLKSWQSARPGGAPAASAPALDLDDVGAAPVDDWMQTLVHVDDDMADDDVADGGADGGDDGQQEDADGGAIGVAARGLQGGEEQHADPGTAVTATAQGERREDWPDWPVVIDVEGTAATAADDTGACKRACPPADQAGGGPRQKRRVFL